MASCFERQDRRRDFTQVIVELMVAAWQVVDAGSRNRARIKIDMGGRHDLILKPVIEMDGDVLGKERAKVRRELQIIG